MLHKSIYFIALIVIFNACTLFKTNHNKDQIMTGVIEQKTFVNKVGKEINDIQDLYFKSTDGTTYFIKLLNSNISYEQAIAILGQNISAEIEVKEGMWDVPDDNPLYAQSRTGQYILIKSYTLLINKKDQ